MFQSKSWNSFCSVGQLILVLAAFSRQMRRTTIDVGVCHAIVPSVPPLRCHLYKMIPACSTNHGSTGKSLLNGSCVELSNVTLDRTDDSANCITASCAESNSGCLRVVLQRNFTVSMGVNEVHDSFNCPKHFDAILQNYTARDVMMPVCFHCNRRPID